MNDFILHTELKQHLQTIIDHSDRLGGVLCFHGLPGCGKTLFSTYYSHLVAREVHTFDANSHLFDKSSASNILKTITEIVRTTSLAQFSDDYNQNGIWDRCFVIDEFHNLSSSRQDAYKISLEKLSQQHNVLFILIVNTSKDKPLSKVLTPAILSRCQSVDFDIKTKHYQEVTAIIKNRYPELDEHYIKKTLPDLRCIVKEAKMMF